MKPVTLFLTALGTISALTLIPAHTAQATEVMINADTGVNVHSIKNRVDTSGALQRAPRTQQAEAQNVTTQSTSPQNLNAMAPSAGPAAPATQQPQTLGAQYNAGQQPAAPDVNIGEGYLVELPWTESEQFARRQAALPRER